MSCFNFTKLNFLNSNSAQLNFPKTRFLDEHLENVYYLFQEFKKIYKISKLPVPVLNSFLFKFNFVLKLK